MLAYGLHLLCQVSPKRVDGEEDLEGGGGRKNSFKRRIFGKNQCSDTAVRRKRNQKVVDLHTVSRRKNVMRLALMTHFFGKLVFHTQQLIEFGKVSKNF